MFNEELFQEAKQFINQCYKELGKTSEEMEERIQDIHTDISNSGEYTHTQEELAHGAKMAWRNNNRCIGRLFWNMLHVFDCRELNTEPEIAHALNQHIEFATNEGRIKPAITIFKPFNGEENQVRIWNHQLIRYAGYNTDNGFIGDPDSIAFTQQCMELGWNPKRTNDEILPLVIQLNDQSPILFNIPENRVMEVSLSHPEYEWFTDFNLKWYATPIISDMSLEIGGILYTAAPFNGWYMGTEIGARNFADPFRFNMLPKIAEKMGLDTSRNSSMWKDKALIELNLAVLHSYKEAGVTIVDHHTAAQQFKYFEQTEEEHGREVTGKWSWLIPPLSPATTHVFHSYYKDEIKKPNYFYQEKPY